MAINPNEAYQHALCMELKPDKFRYAVIHKDNKKIIESEDFKLDSFDRNSVEEFIKNDHFKADYGSFVLSSGGRRNTLVPNDIFNNSKPQEIFKLNYSDPAEDLDHNRIPELGIVNIYELPTWIKSAFIPKFPRIRIVHPSTVILKGIFDQPNFHDRAYLYIDDEDFYLMITGNNKLQFFNRFDYKEISDVIYHLLFVLEQKEYSQEEISVVLYGVKSDWEAIQVIQQYFKKQVKVASNREMAEDFILSRQLLCV